MIKHTGRRGKELGLECFFFLFGGGGLVIICLVQL